MFNFLTRMVPAIAALLPSKRGIACDSDSGIAVIPDPAEDIALTQTSGQETAVVAGGCFWGIQAVFEHVRGVIRAVSGYAGGAANTAHYDMVCSGRTGHAEAVQITYDPSRISYGQLLKVFFSVAHNPTEMNRQGPDAGTQYRSAIFYKNADQKLVAQSYIDQLGQAKAFSAPIVTQVVPLEAFYPAEDYHQDYAFQHPENMYIAINDLPKVENLRTQFPQLYIDKRT